MPNTKPWYRSKVLWLNLVALLLITAEANLHIMSAEIPPKAYAWIAYGLALANTALRFVTQTAIGLAAGTTIPQVPLDEQPGEGRMP